MATQADPWAEFSPQTPGAPQPIIPPQPPPVRPAQATIEGAEAEQARRRQAAEAAKAEADARAAAAAAEIAERRAATDRTQQQNYPQVALDSFDRAIDTIDRLGGSPGLGPAVGSLSFNPSDIAGGQIPFGTLFSETGATPGSPARNFRADLETLKAQVFLPMVQALRGMGALSNMEGQRLTDAIGALDVNMSEGQFQRSLARIRGDLLTYRARGSGSRAPPPTPPWITNRAAQDEGEVAFNDEPTPPQRGRPEGEAGFRASLEAEVMSGRITTPGQFIERARQLNPALAQYLERGDYQTTIPAFVRARRQNPATQFQLNPFYLPPDADSPSVESVRGEGGAMETADAAIRGVADVPTLGLADEIAAGVDTLFGDRPFGENLWLQRGIDAYDEEHHPWARLGGQLGGSLLLPTRVGTAAFGGAREAYAAGRGLPRETLRANMRRGATGAAARRLGVEGGAFGGAYGFGSGEGDLGDRLASGGVSALVGGGAGYGLGRLLGPAFNRTGPSARYADRLEAFRAAQAAEELGPLAGAESGAFNRAGAMDMMPADVGGAFTRRATSAGAQFPFSAASVVNASRRTIAQGRTARDRIASDIAEPLEVEAAGEAAMAGTQAFRTSSRSAVNRAYGRAEELAGDARINPENARQMLDQHIAELAESPTGAPAALTALRSQLDGDFTVSGLRNLRTRIRDDLGQQGLRGSDTERRAMMVVDALADDIAGGLTRAGRADAAEAYRAADTLHRERVQTIDNVLRPIIGARGEKSGEEVVQGLQRAMQGNSARARAFMDTLPVPERDSVRSTLIAQLGRSPKGQQNAEGDAFSLSTFLTNWTAMQPTARAAVFGEAANKALGQLAQVANRSRQAEAFANRSNTGGVVGTGMTVGTGYAGWPVLLGAVAGQMAAGKLLASPVVARWMAREPRNPAQTISHIGKLSNIARTHPAIASEITGLQQALLRQLGNDVGRAAAGGEEE